MATQFLSEPDNIIFPFSAFADSVYTQQAQVDAGDGIVALIELYYNDYSDADHLEDDFLRILYQLGNIVTILNTGIDQIIWNAEKKIRRSGRQVRTIKMDPAEG